MTSFEKKRDEFRSYLECAGVIDSLSKALIKLYEQSEKPEDAVKFLRDKMCEECPTEEEFTEVKSKYEEAMDQIEKLQRELSSLKGNLRKSPSEIQLALESGFEALQSDDSHNSMLKQFLTRELFDELKEVQTSFKSTLLDCINTGLANHDSHIGIYAPDAEAYTVFGKLFDSIIEEYHKQGEDNPVGEHPASDWGDPAELGNLDPDNEFIRSTRVRCARSVEGVPFNPRMTEKDYEDLMEKVKGITECMEGEFSGTFHPLLGMDKATQQKLIDDHFLFKEGDRFLEAGGACRFWPVGRGIFLNESKTFLVWCCEEDHLRIISMENSGDLGKVYGRLKDGVEHMAANLQFSRNDRFGYLTFCPTNLGTTIRASVHINLPKLASDRAKLEEIADKFNLQVRGTRGEHTESDDGYYDISNKRRLGLTEFEAVKEMYNGIKEMIDMEKSM